MTGLRWVSNRQMGNRSKNGNLSRLGPRRPSQLPELLAVFFFGADSLWTYRYLVAAFDPSLAGKNGAYLEDSGIAQPATFATGDSKVAYFFIAAKLPLPTVPPILGEPSYCLQAMGIQ